MVARSAELKTAARELLRSSTFLAFRSLWSVFWFASITGLPNALHWQLAVLLVYCQLMPSRHQITVACRAYSPANAPRSKPVLTVLAECSGLRLVELCLRAPPVWSVRASCSNRISSGNHTRAGILCSVAAFADANHSLCSAAAGAAAPASVKLDAKEFKPIEIISATKYNHNTKSFRLRADTADLPVSSFVLTSFKGADGKDVVRPYTPVSQKAGELELLIKARVSVVSTASLSDLGSPRLASLQVYPGAAMGGKFDTLKAGDKIDVK
jgi:hypothetical protein